ncbi:MAG TPA: DUF5776 domain-containing protein [Levilactobacillus hammesii]|uniref:DUF5776 domain-containing protein n=1 Tax=Levilactobacillus hammesii TaxID=267633 RepID=A0A921EZZ8_9LACO|nr:DUF5776 domain-containing protein [Levilactobacillus hammesii]
MKKVRVLLAIVLGLSVFQPVVTVRTPDLAPTAQAAVVRAVPTSGRYGDVDWNLTADGTLHLGAGRLGEPESLVANAGQLSTQIVLAQGGIPSLTTTQAAADQVTRVVLDGTVTAPKNATGLFRQLRNVTDYQNLARLETAQTTTMSGMFMVNGFDAQITTLDVSHFDTAQVADMNFMFYGLPALQQLDLWQFDTSRVTTMMSMFNGTTALRAVDFANGTFERLRSGMYAFSGSGVTRVALPKFTPGTDFYGSALFYGAKHLAQLTLGPQSRFRGATNLNTPVAGDQYTGDWQAVDTGTVQNPLGERFASGADLISLYDGSDRPSSVETYVWEPVDRVIEPPIVPPVEAAAPVTVQYRDEQAQSLAADRLLTGRLGESYTAEPLDFDGYHLTKTVGAVTGTFSPTAQTVTFHYAPDVVTGGDGDHVAPINAVVYATKKVGLYRTKNFSDQSRRFYYAKRTRTQRPMFVVTGYATSKNGHRRYRVRDVNHQSKTAGKTGYVTAKSAYVTNVYYAKRPVKVKVISRQGANGYRRVALTGKVHHYRKGQVLKVKKLVTYRKTTRLVLTNGQYVTANKKLVIAE